MTRRKKKKLVFLSGLDLTDKRQGFTAVFIGIGLALILGLISALLSGPILWIYYLILGLGIVLGILNIFHEEGLLFLLSGLTITFMLNLLVSLQLFPERAVIPFYAVICLLAPASIVVGLKILYALTVR